jgi:hypothetical protein
MDTTTQSKNPLSAQTSLNPLKGVLYPIQLQLGQCVVVLSIATSVSERKCGQNLSGDMIPVREVQAAEVEKESTGSSESKKRGFLRPRRRNGACTEWSGVPWSKHKCYTP